MEHLDVIVRIIEAEQAAQKVADEVWQKKQTLAEDLVQQKNEIHESLIQRAQRRIEIVRQQEQQDANESLATLDGKFQLKQFQMERRFEENREKWVDELFQFMIHSTK